jgi:hypothetical protein
MKHLIAAALVGALLGGAAMVSVPAMAETEQKTEIPQSAAAILAAIDGHLGQLQAGVAKGPLGNVHMHAFAIRDLVNALPAHSPMLSASAIATVQAQAKFVDVLAARLDQTGDANDRAGTADNLKKLENVLKVIKGQYKSP